MGFNSELESAQNRKSAQKTYDLNTLTRVLAHVPKSRAFLFYEKEGKPTGDSATSLSDFCDKINTIPDESVAFHLRRGDFENWIEATINDPVLATRIHRLRINETNWTDQVKLRNQLYKIVSRRLKRLNHQLNNTSIQQHSVPSLFQLLFGTNCTR